MPVEALAGVVSAGVVLTILVLREFSRRVGVTYEYRWETFAVRGPGGRQLLHVRKNEIQSIEPLTLRDRVAGLGRFKQLSRTSFAPKVLIRTNIAHAKPVIVSWEGRLIAGLKPDGLRLRSGEAERKG